MHFGTRQYKMESITTTYTEGPAQKLENDTKGHRGQKKREKNVSWLHSQHTLQLEDGWAIYCTLPLGEKAWSDK